MFRHEPMEVALRILEKTAEDDRAMFPDTLNIVRLRLVSKRWRAIVDGYGPLWTNLLLIPPRLIPRSRLEQRLRDGTPLQCVVLSFGASCPELLERVDMLLDEANHAKVRGIGTLFVESGDRRMLPQELTKLSELMNLMRPTVVHLGGRGASLAKISTILQPTALQSRGLTVPAAFRWSSLRVLEWCDTETARVELFEILASAIALEELKARVQAGPSAGPRVGATLKRVVLGGRPESLGRVLARLAMPSVQFLEVEIDEQSAWLIEGIYATGVAPDLFNLCPRPESRSLDRIAQSVDERWVNAQVSFDGGREHRLKHKEGRFSAGGQPLSWLGVAFWYCT